MMLNAALHWIQSYGLISSLAIAVGFVIWQLNHNEDLRPHRLSIAISFALLGVGPVIWLIFSRTEHRFGGTLLAVLVGGLALRLFLKIVDRATNDFIGGLVFDMIFSDGAFGAVFRPPKKLPNLGLLRHWRATGAARKAYRTARRSLLRRPDAYPIWLFAAETAAVHLNKMPAAIRIVRRLCVSNQFTDDQKTFALSHLKGWAAEKGCNLDVEPLRRTYGPAPKLKPLRRVDRLRSKGRYLEARNELLGLLRRNPEDLAAAVLLVRVYAQDLQNRDKAQELIGELERTPFTPTSVTDYLRNSLDEWSRAPGLALARNAGPALSLSRCETESETTGLSLARARALSLVQSLVGRRGRPSKPEKPARPAFTENLSPEIASLVNEGLLGRAVDALRDLIQQKPDDLALRLQLAQVWVLNCKTLSAGERTIREIEGDPRFTDVQKTHARAQLTLWQKPAAEPTPSARRAEEPQHASAAVAGPATEVCAQTL